MKKISFMALVGVLAIAPAFAEFAEPTVAVVTEEVVVQNNTKGGFVSDKETIVTVKQVNEMRDDVPVIVQGHILQRMGDEKYLFEDSTGSITVEIDDDDWRGQTISPSDTVKLYGEVDRGIFKTQIEVDYVQKI
ncbi:MAG: NirD/YgiW/YdeI family stress tolerance protein [Pseudomonadota bacterium]|nr:NirD/YgiW/YdeI family stress tolerance protein [Alphaproteobacteria bacterium]MDO4423272.1 NirD/YgiW/YdeI family stress tolerance protein [Pseudomonadota bacterium]